MKVCFYKPASGEFLATDGGVQRISRILEKEFLKQGIEVYFLTTKDGDKESQSKRNVFCLPTTQIDSRANRKALKEYLASIKINILINQDAINQSSYRLIEGLKGKVKIISVHHNCVRCLYERYENIARANRSTWLVTILDRFKLWDLVRQLYLIRSKRQWKRIHKVSDQLVLYFDSFAHELYSLYGIPPEQVKIITNPAPYPTLVEEKKVNKEIIYVGRIEVNQKRIDKLLELWNRLHKKHTDWNFTIVGSGRFMDEALRIKEANELSRIRFVGHDEPLDYWDKADIFTLTSDYEGFGLVLIEAQARAVVPVTFRCFSAIDEVVGHDQTGLIIDDFDIEEMEKAVDALIADQSKLLRLRARGQTMNEKFKSDQIANQWISLFSELVSS